MRPWISPLLLGAGLTALIAVPAAANTMTPRSPVMAVHNGDVHAPFHRHHFLRAHPGFAPFVLSTPLFLPYEFYGGGVASGTPSVIILSEPSAVAASPPVPAAEQRPSVETTAEGVVVVRGPGSRHLGY
jgi:hypothetical protein